MEGGMKARQGTCEGRLYVLVHGEDGPVVEVDVGLEELPRIVLCVGRVDVAAPDKLRLARFRALEGGDHGAGLGVVHDDEVVFLVAIGRVLLANREILRLHLVGDGYVHTLQGIVEKLGDGEEIGIALQEVPLRLQSDAAHQRHQRVEQFRHPASVGRAVDVRHPRALQPLREVQDLVDDLVAGDAAVALDVLRLYRHHGQHIRPPGLL